jgi:BASS family bile acid:Na+ symporter
MTNLIAIFTTYRQSDASRLYGKTLALALAMGLGALLPQAAPVSVLIPYLLMTMLFFSSLDLTISRHSFNKDIVLVLVANLLIAFLAYFLLLHVDMDLALVAFMTAIAPTATAAPIIINFLDGHVDFVVAAVLLTNVFMALAVPFILPLVVSTHVAISTWQVLQSVLVVVLLPLALAALFSRLPRGTQAVIRRGKSLSFPIWLFNLFLVSSKSTAFLLQDRSVSATLLIKIALISLVLCIINFAVGNLLASQEYKQESSQALGQKNNSFVIWLALAFINPLVALGPTFYVIYHNAYNSFQLYTFEKKRSINKVDEKQAQLSLKS